MHIQVNGEPRELDNDITLQQLVASLNLKSERIAVELNGIVVRQAQWNSAILKAGDKIEIVHFVGGG